MIWLEKDNFFNFHSRGNFWRVVMRAGKFFNFTVDSAPLPSPPSPTPKIPLVETAMSKNHTGRNPDQK